MQFTIKQLTLGLAVAFVTSLLGVVAYRLALHPVSTPPTTATTADNRTWSDLLNAGYVQRSTTAAMQTSAAETSGTAAPEPVRPPRSTATAATDGALQISVMSQGPRTTASSGQFAMARAGQSYTAALEEHGSYRLQLDGCASRPPHQTYANGSWVMMDNRSPVSVVLSYAGQKYSISRYGYQIVRLKSDTVPHAIQVDCWNGRYWANNAAQITLQ